MRPGSVTARRKGDCNHAQLPAAERAEGDMPLRTGTYEARWQSTGADGHKMVGKLTFNVR